MATFLQLSRAFKFLIEQMPDQRGSDGHMAVEFHSQVAADQQGVSDRIVLVFHSYCIPNMDRQHRIGPFTTEYAAIEAGIALLKKQLPDIQEHLKKKGGTLKIPSLLQTPVQVNSFHN